MKINWGIFTWASPLTNSHFSALKNDPFFEFQVCNENEIWFFSLKQILVSPNLSQLSWSLKCQFPMRMKYYFTRNKSLWQFPQIWVNVKAGESWSPPCEAVFRHFVMKKSEPKWLHINIYVRGRANQSFPPSFVPKKWLYQASTFFAPALRGSPHSSQNQIRNKSKWQSDDEMSWLV